MKNQFFKFRDPRSEIHALPLSGILYLLMLLPVLMLISCNKDEVKPINEGGGYEEVVSQRKVDPKAFTAFLKDWKSGALESRDPVTYSLPDAINEIETYFSYNYGNYDVQTSAKYSFSDTITVSYSSLPMTESEVGTFTEQVRTTGESQMDEMPGDSSDKFFYWISLNVITQSSSSAQIAVSSYFGKDEVTWSNPPSLPTPVTFSIPYPLDADNYGSCTDPNNTTIKGAPRQLSDDINELLPSQQPNPRAWYEKVYFTDQLKLWATSTTPNFANYLDDLFKADNAADADPHDGVDDWIVYRREGPNFNDPDKSCPYTCIDNTRYNYYGQDMWSILNQTKTHYGRNYILGFQILDKYSYDNYVGEINWTSSGTAIFATYIKDDTRGKVPFPGDM